MTRIPRDLSPIDEAASPAKVQPMVNSLNLSLRKRRGKQRLKLERVPLHECRAINKGWSMDFVSDCLASGRRNPSA